MELQKMGTVKDVANHPGMGWNTVKEMHREYLQARYGRPSLKVVTIDMSAAFFISVVENAPDARIVSDYSPFMTLASLEMSDEPKKYYLKGA